MTLSGQPFKMPLVACHHAPSNPARRNARELPIFGRRGA